MTPEIKSVAIVGAGTMGAGIAQVCATSGFATILFDVNKELLKKSLKNIEQNLEAGVQKNKLTSEQKIDALQRITMASSLAEVKADLIIEAVVEKLEVKHQLFKSLEEINTTTTVLATNTSSIPITQIAAVLQRPENCIGLHFFNPAHIMKLVEVIAGAATRPELVPVLVAFTKRLDKVAVVAKDSPGFIVNRVARHYYVEALKALEEGVADHAQIDQLMRSAGFKMGPFELMDLIGVDTNFSVTSSMYQSFHQDAKFRPSRIQHLKVLAGHHGRKSGKGFYEYPQK